MKKQINPTIKAHLLRGAFYLLLLLAVCAIPFALAQRNRPSSTQAQATKAPPTKAQIAAASGKVIQLGAPGALAGRAAARNPATGQNALPYDVRTAPSLPPISQLPLNTSGPDQVYRINGTTGGAGCSSYNTTTGQGSITPGSTDTGNHCDDCSTNISFPFPVSVYGQIFNSANVASKGSLDFVGVQAPFTHGCLTLPDNRWDMAIFPYQDDLRTDNLGWTGCNAFPGSTCGIFTSTTGTAPNRLRHVRSLVMRLRAITMPTRIPTRPARVSA